MTIASPPPLPPVPARLRLIGAATRLATIARELRRRGILVGQSQPGGVQPPQLRLLVGEVATFVRVRGAALLPGTGRRHWPAEVQGTARPVMLLPGFATHPRRMETMASALTRAGHRVGHWGMGTNLGPTQDNFAQLCRTIVEQAEREGEPLALVGWSLGGLFAREAAKRHPDAVAVVVTLGTPFSGDPHANRGWRWYQGVTGHEVTAPPVSGDFAAKPPVRTIALWSPRDGVVAPRSARGRPGERDEAVALRCTHLGFPHHPLVVAEVLRQLAR